MAGRKRQPLAVIQGKGKSNHLTKKDIREREEQESALRGNADKVIAPEHLTKKQKEEFDRIATDLVDLNIFSNLDVDFLSRYIESKSEYEKVTKEMRGINNLSDPDAIKLYSELRINRNTFFNECKTAAVELGLSITSRLKLVVPKTEKKEVSEFEKKFGDV